jgi:hypothetical protein
MRRRGRGNRVAGKPLERCGHVFDGGVFVLIGHRAGRMSHDGVTHARINPGLNRSALERMPPTVVGLDLRMIDPEGPDPLCQPLRGLHCRPPVVGAPGRLGGSVVKERPGRLALDPGRKPLLDQIGMKGHHTDVPRLDGPSLGGDAYHPTDPWPVFDILPAQLRQLPGSCSGVGRDPRNPTLCGGKRLLEVDRWW